RPSLLPPGAVTLARQVEHAEQHDAALEGAVRPLTNQDGQRPLPRKLTARARRVLEMGRDLLSQLHPLAEAFAAAGELSGLIAAEHPVARHYRQATSVVDSALRLVSLLPSSAAAQLRLCEGLEGILLEVASRVRFLTAAVQQRRDEDDRINRLASLLTE